MLEFVRLLFDTSDFPPRWHCGQWTATHGWIHVGSDIATWGAYTAIPLVLTYFVMRRNDVPYHRLFWLFALFIFGCGSVHLAEAIIFWHPIYRLSGLLKFTTAIASWATVVALIRITPQALRLPGLAAANAQLEAEMIHRKMAQETLRQSEERYQALVTGTHNIVWVSDNSGRFVAQQDSWSRYTGQAADQYQNWGWQEAIHADDRPGVAEIWNEPTGRSTVIHAQGRLWHAATNSYRPFVAEAVPVLNRDGSIREWVGTITDVYDKERAQEAVIIAEAESRRKQRELESIYAISPIGMSLIDRERRYLRINQSLADINGYPCAYHLGKTVTEVVPTLEATLAPMHAHVLRTGEPILDVEISGRLPPESEQLRWLSVSHYPLQDDHDVVIGVSSFVQEITERKLWETQLRQANERVTKILESIADGFVFFDHEWRYRYVNQTAARLLGKAVDEMLGEEVRKVFPDRSGNTFREHFDEAVSTGLPVEFEAYYGPLNSWYECRCYPSEEGLSIFFSDTTERKRAEQALQESEQRFRQLADSMPQIVFAARPDGFVDYYNERWYEFTGSDRDKEGDESWAPIIHPDDLERCVHAWYDSVRTGKRYQIEYRFLHNETGKYRWYLGRALPVHDRSGNIVRWFGSCTDIHRQKLIENKLHKSAAAAASASLAKSEFLANMSHEIRTPMTAIMGYADLLLAHLRDPDNRDCVLTIKRNGHHLLDIINDILDLSRIEAGKLELDLQECSPCSIVSDVQSLMQVRADERHIDLLVEFEGKLPRTIQSDEKRIRQVLINLVGNAVKFTEQGYVELRTRLLTGSSPAILQFEVRDTGIGMSPAQLKRLFQPFSQGDTSVTREFGGSGLGLAITHRLLEMLGGHITVESQLGTGSLFQVQIPVGPVDRLELAEPQTAPKPSDVPVAPRAIRPLRCTVLVVDDRREIRYLTRHFLEEAGAEVMTVEDGEAGIEAVREAEQSQRDFDIILMDMQMPKMDGYTAVSHLRAMGCVRPIIALTADAMQGDRERCLNAGCDDYLSKPIESERLVDLILQYTQEIALDKLQEIRSRRIEALQPRSDRSTTDSQHSQTRDGDASSDSSMRTKHVRVLVVDQDADTIAEGIADEIRALRPITFTVETASDAPTALTKMQQFRPHLILVDTASPTFDADDLARQLRHHKHPQQCVLIALSPLDEHTHPDDLEQNGFDHRWTKPIDLHQLHSLATMILGDD